MRQVEIGLGLLSSFNKRKTAEGGKLVHGGERETSDDLVFVLSSLCIDYLLA